MKILILALSKSSIFTSNNLDLQHRVQELENRLSLNSSNSSIPPSKNPLNKKVKRNHNSREKTGKPPGGQPGHPGKTLVSKNEPDDVIDYTSDFCSHCSSILSTNDQFFIEERQDVEIPEIQVQTLRIGYMPVLALGVIISIKESFPLISHRKSNMGSD
ncbi:hypothetical protein DK846_16655 [Methanospirillum lacunae]|uniref:DUF6444 domain-containing protein n=1 Tax=Methanospirillum lacunae TaxID=668570 RepID=A0A2V2MWM1_9EURY|nr:hypothetical protein DK846_16655 [Methanospirillum lacunae]